MPVLQTTLHGMNNAFGSSKIKTTVKNRDRFAPGQPVHEALADHGATPGSELNGHLREHLDGMPGAIKETLRAVIHHALGTKPPTKVTFAWAPGYDHEVTIWQAPDAEKTKGGITVLVKTRYPIDRHPLKKRKAS